MGCGIGWSDGDLGHGRAYRFRDPDDHVFELYYETRRYEAPAAERPALKNQAQRYHGRGVASRRLDHVNLLATGRRGDPRLHAEGARQPRHRADRARQRQRRRLLVHRQQQELRHRLRERPYRRRSGRFHHVTYAVDQREHILRAADIFLENGVHIETGPHKHAIQQTFFLYVYEPAGNRVEIANAGARLILAPDWQTVTWTETERKKGQAWGLKTIESFHTHGTPPVRSTTAA